MKGRTKINYEKLSAGKQYSLLEAVADISYSAGQLGYRPNDSRAAINNFIIWAVEFENENRKVEWGITPDKDYIEEIDLFTQTKIKQNE